MLTLLLLLLIVYTMLKRHNHGPKTEEAPDASIPLQTNTSVQDT